MDQIELTEQEPASKGRFDDEKVEPTREVSLESIKGVFTGNRKFDAQRGERCLDRELQG